MNLLCLGSRVVGTALAWELVQSFLRARYSRAERFERRLVRTGLRDGELVGIADGLAPGERVVTRGAYLVHLAAGAPAEAGHGHTH